VIGVVTSPTGAVIRDILHRLEDRFPTHVIVWPVLVQGQGAAEQVAAAVRGFGALKPGGAMPRPDLLIVARGGGSIEDLWGFNEEVVVRAVAQSPIPVISAVGHETDTTLCDFAADKRAPTPTAAAEMAVPVRRELAATLDDLALRQRKIVMRPLDLGRERLEARVNRLPNAEQLLQPQVQRLDDLSGRLRQGLIDRAARGRERLAEARLSPAILRGALRDAKQRLGAARLEPALVSRPIAEQRQRLDAWGGRLRRGLHDCAALGREALGKLRLSDAVLERNWREASEKLEDARLEPALITRRIAEQRGRLDALWRLAEQLHPEKPLSRGYAMVLDPRGKAITSAAAAGKQTSLGIKFSDGAITAVPGGSPNRPRKTAKAPPESGQPKLL